MIHIPIPCHFGNQKSASSKWVPHNQTSQHMNDRYPQKVLLLMGPRHGKADGTWPICEALVLVRRISAVAQLGFAWWTHPSLTGQIRISCPSKQKKVVMPRACPKAKLVGSSISSVPDS